MLDEMRNTLRSRTPSLLPLRTALRAAERESPARPPRTPVDANERLALQLIERMKAEYKRRHFMARIVCRGEMIPSYAGDCYIAEERQLAMT